MRVNPADDRSDGQSAGTGRLYAILITANLAAWVWAWICCFHAPALTATACLAYSFGLRHAFDADHIAAIDNVVRKLMQDGKRPAAAGLFFSLGHSTVVTLGTIAIAAAATALHDHLAAFRVVGTVVSAAFLFAIGVANLCILRGIWAAFCRARRLDASPCDGRLDRPPPSQGLLVRLFRFAFGFVRVSWHMYPIGLLFGLGFDTATEIGLLGIAATQAAQGMQVWTLLVFPALFTAGMSLMDTTDSVLMTGAYGWALIHPLRKLWYNLTITAASVAVALLIGGIETLGLIADKLGRHGRFWQVVGSLNDNFTNVGFGVVGIFAAAWIISAVVYRAKGYELSAAPLAVPRPVSPDLRLRLARHLPHVLTARDTRKTAEFMRATGDHQTGKDPFAA